MRISDGSSDVCSSDLPDTIAGRIAGWRDGRYRSLRSAAALAAFDAMLPALVDALAGVDEPEAAMLRFEALLASTSSAINLLDRKSVVEGKSVSVRVDLSGRRILKKKK